jgi:hypothetical protein
MSRIALVIVVALSALLATIGAAAHPPHRAIAQRRSRETSCRRDQDCVVAATECCEPCGVYGPPSLRAMSFRAYARFRVHCRAAMCPACVSHPDTRYVPVCRAGTCTLDDRGG